MNERIAALSRIILVSSVMLLSISAISSATDYVWDNDANDGNWNTPANWNPETVPGTASGQYARIRQTSGPVFNGQTASVYRVYLETAGNGTLTMNTGSLTTVNHVYLAATSTDVGTLNMNGGTLTVGGTFYVGRDTGSIGTVNLFGGTIDCATLSIRLSGGTGTIYIEGNGKLIFTSINTPITTVIQNGWIRAYDGLGSVVVETIGGRTVVTGLISHKATVPRPGIGAPDMTFNATTLGWNPGVDAVSHDVYLGTVFEDVNNAQRSAGDLNGNGVVDFNDMARLTQYWLLDPNGSEPYAGVNSDNTVNFLDYALLAQDWMNSAAIFKGNTDVNSFDPGTLAFGTPYYWRVDEVTGPVTTKGDVWSFATYSGKSVPLAPLNGSSDVLSRGVLSWTGAPGAASHDVYFGTTNPPPFAGNQTATFYNPGTMANSTTYYWRIDEKYSVGTVTGDVMSFTTIDAASEPDLVFVQASDPQMGWAQCTGIANEMDYMWGLTIGKINNLNPDLMIVTGDLTDNSTNVDQYNAYKSYRAGLNPTIECYEVPGNHDLSEPSSQTKYDAWATKYGYGSSSTPHVPWYSFAYGDSFFIGLDSQVLRYPFDGLDVVEVNWLTAQLQDANAAGYSHIFVFMHNPMFIASLTENDERTVHPPVRDTMRDLFTQYHVDAVFAGHTHTNAYVLDGSVEYITTTSCTCGLGSPRTPQAVCVIKVYSDHVEHEIRNLDTLP
jgi:predicted MPP superfamily phosphohydrolase